VRLEIVSLPDPMHGGVRNTGPAGHLTCRPLTQAALGFSERDRYDLSTLAGEGVEDVLTSFARSRRPSSVSANRRGFLATAREDAMTSLNLTYGT
jgi:hypothetical protein